MAEGDDLESKTEEATPKKRQEAFEKGHFPKAEEVSVVFLLIAALSIAVLDSQRLIERVANLATTLLNHVGNILITHESVENMVSSSLEILFLLIAPVLVLSLLAAIVAGGLQTGFHLTPKVIEISSEKLNPARGLKNLFSKHALTQAIVDCIKFGAIGGIIYQSIQSIIHDPLFAVPIPFEHIVDFLRNSFIKLFAHLIAAMSGIAIAHYMYQRFKTNRNLRMTRQEIKDEFKQQEVDALIKQRRRQQALEYIKGQMLSDVPLADVIITNPTHYAVALKYEKGKDLAPIVLAKGENLLAQRIKDIAQKEGVPMVENKIAARMLFRIGAVGQPIPAELYKVVAEILSYVYKKHRYYFHRLKTRRLERENTIINPNNRSHFR